MDSSQIVESTEECNSGNEESGWTMYINSSSTHGSWRNNKDHQEDDKSDDSMASDASSGPSYQKFLSQSFCDEQHDDDKSRDDKRHSRSFSSGKKLQKQAKEKEEHSAKGKRELKLKDDSSSSYHVRKGSKGRKTR